MNEVQESWYDWTYDGRGWYLVNDPEITFDSQEEADAYCDEHNRALAGQAAIEERKRILNLINGRMSIHNEFINDCVKHDVRVSDSFFTALAELRSIVREIERLPS